MQGTLSDLDHYGRSRQGGKTELGLIWKLSKEKKKGVPGKKKNNNNPQQNKSLLK